MEKAKPWMEPRSRQTSVPANDSGSWDRQGVPGEGLPSQRCHRWQVCRSRSSLPTLPALKKPLECEPRKQTGSWPEQGPLADNCGPLVSVLGWAATPGAPWQRWQQRWHSGHSPESCPPLTVRWEGAVPQAPLEAASNHRPNNGRKIAVWERGREPVGIFQGKGCCAFVVK